MASGYRMSGYGDPNRRVRSAFPSERSTADRCPGVSQDELAHIKAQAKRMWTPIQQEPTTYGHFFNPKNLSVRGTCRPTSPTRRNNPHPPNVFLVNRLHFIPGYHNPDTTMGKDVFQVDSSLPPHIQAQRREPREKFRAQRSDASINQYKKRNNFYYYLKPTESQAIDAWSSFAKDKVNTDYSQYPDDVSPDPVIGRSGHWFPSETAPVASLHRYLRPAGVSESDHVLQVMDTRQSDQQPRFRSSLAKPQMTLMDMKEADLEAVTRVRVNRKPYRGDFLIHPEWPPNMPHHRIPGY